MRTRSRNRAGFTLVELVVVVAVITLLAGITVPLVADRVEDAQVERARVDMATVASAFTAFKADNGFWPDRNSARSLPDGSYDFDYYRCLFRKLSPTWKNWDGPYLDAGIQVGSHRHAAYNGAGLVDPWGRYYRVYQYAKTQSFPGAIVIASGGPDGKIRTGSSKALREEIVGDDLVLVVTRKL